MSFIEEHPNYKSYTSSSDLHYSDLPYNFSWSEFESVIDEAGGPDREYLSKIIQMIATKVRAGNVDDGLAYHWIPHIVSTIKKRIDEGKFYLFMDCLAILCEDGDLTKENLNEFLEDYNIGYRAVSGWGNNIAWDKVEPLTEKEDDVDVSEYKPLLLLNNADFITSKEQLKKAKDNMKSNAKSTKIFITHSSNDKEYVLILTEFLRHLNVPPKSIVCTSDPRHKIPNGENAYAWLKRQFTDSRLHMIFVLSENYYRSNPCLNEMGAAWLVAEKSDLLLLPGFNFADLKKKDGCLDKEIQGGSIDSDDRMLKAWLTNLRNDVLSEFDLSSIDEFDWEDYRDEFISKMRSVKATEKDEDSNKVEDGDDYKIGDEDEKSDISNNPIVQIVINAGGAVNGISPIVAASGFSETTVKRKLKEALDNGEIEVVGAGRHKIYRVAGGNYDTPVVGQDDVGNIPADSALLLVYAASDNGQIIKIQTLGSPVQVSAAGKQFMADDSQRESARWVEALDRLISWGWVKAVGTKGQIYELTGTGYQKADWLKEGMDINTDNEPLDELKQFGG